MGPNNFFRRFRSSSNNNYYVANSYPTGTTAEPKSKTKLLIIVIIVAVILVSIFAIVGSMRGSRKTRASTDTISALNHYANWVLYGEDSEEDFSKEAYDESRLYSAEEKLTDESSKESLTFFKTAEELFDVFYDYYLNDDKASEKVFGAASGSKALLSFFIDYLNTGEIDDDDQLLNLYKSKGYEGALSYIEKFYEPYYKNGTAVAEGFAEEKKTNEKNLLEIYHIYDQGSCLYDDSTCQISDEDQKKIESLRKENNNLSINQNPMYMGAFARTLQMACYDLKGELDV